MNVALNLRRRESDVQEEEQQTITASLKRRNRNCLQTTARSGQELQINKQRIAPSRNVGSPPAQPQNSEVVVLLSAPQPIRGTRHKEPERGDEREELQRWVLIARRKRERGERRYSVGFSLQGERERERGERERRERGGAVIPIAKCCAEPFQGREDVEPLLYFASVRSTLCTASDLCHLHDKERSNVTHPRATQYHDQHKQQPTTQHQSSTLQQHDVKASALQQQALLTHIGVVLGI